MAEEIDIRSIWNKSKEKEDPSSLHINMLEKKGTKTTLYWMKFILWIEFWLSIAMLPFLVRYQMIQKDLDWAITFYIVLVILYLFYYQFLIRQINRFNYDANVIQSLKKVYGYLRFYVWHYKVMIWISLVAGAVFGVYAPENAEVMTKIDTTSQWVKFILVMSVMIGIIGSILHFLIHLIYGRKIKRLKGIVKDLESGE